MSTRRPIATDGAGRIPVLLPSGRVTRHTHRNAEPAGLILLRTLFLPRAEMLRKVGVCVHEEWHLALTTQPGRDLSPTPNPSMSWPSGSSDDHMVGHRGGRFGHCSRILPVWKWPLLHVSRLPRGGTMVERDFRLTGGKSLIDGIPVFPRSKSLGVASHRAIAAPGSADGTLLTYVDLNTMWTACRPGSRIRS